MTPNLAAGENAGLPDPLGQEEREALAEDVALLVRLADRELDAETLARLRERPPREWFALELEGEDVESIIGHVTAGLAEFSDPPTTAELDELAAEFAAIHLNHGYGAAATESVWRDEDGLEKQDAMFLVREWYALHGVKAADWRLRSDDHLVNELQFLALMLRGATNGARLKETATFLRDHPLVWFPRFADRIAKRCELQFYAGVTLLSAVYLERLAAHLGVVTGLDMTPPKLIIEKPKAPAGPNCGSPRNTPLSGPSW